MLSACPLCSGLFCLFGSGGDALHAKERHYLRHGPGLLVGQASLALQLYDATVTCGLPDLRTATMVWATPAA